MIRYLGIDMLKEGLDLLMEGGLWDKARATAASFHELTDYVEERVRIRPVLSFFLFFF